MPFDSCEHKTRLLLIEVAKALRKRDGKPEESNITILYQEAVDFLGMKNTFLKSSDINRLPAPKDPKRLSETIKSHSEQFRVPVKGCPQCGKLAFVLAPICPSCKDSENGRYHSGWKCGECGHIGEKSPKFFAQQLDVIGIKLPTGPKKTFGIKTITDKGLE